MTNAKIEVLKAQIEDLKQRRPDELPEGVAYHEQSTPNPDGYNDPSVGFTELVCISEEFQSLIDHPLVMDVLAAIMPAKIRLDQSYGFIFKQHSGGLNFHGGPAADAGGYEVSNGKIFSLHTVVAVQLDD